jgi:hypothetical protein
MIDRRKLKSSRGVLAAGALILVVLGAAGGAGAVQATHPMIEMAPTIRTPIIKLPMRSGVVTVKGRVAEVFGDRFVVQDASGRAMVAVRPGAQGAVRVGQPVMVQGHFREGQLRASYLINQNGIVAVVDTPGPQAGRPAAPAPHGPAHDGPPPPPPGCAPEPAGSPVPPRSPAALQSQRVTPSLNGGRGGL